MRDGLYCFTLILMMDIMGILYNSFTWSNYSGDEGNMINRGIVEEEGWEREELINSIRIWKSRKRS